MGKFIRTALVFMGGMTAGGYCVVNAALKSQTFTTALKDAIAKKTVEVVYGEEPRAIRRRVSYYDYNTYRHDRKAPNCCSECCQDIVFQTREDAETALSSMSSNSTALLAWRMSTILLDGSRRHMPPINTAGNLSKMPK